MASSSNNLMDEFEESFQACLHALTKQESNSGVTKDEIELEVEQTANKFIDLARQMESFFLQKRFLISTLKPEMLLKDENQELRYEIQRKDVLISKHYDRLEEWKQLLSETQQGYSKSIPNQNELRPPIGAAVMPPQPGPSMMGPSMPSMQQQQQMQQQLQQQQQQQQQMQANVQQMYIQQGPSSMAGRPPPFNPPGNNLLQGPLAYLEKTTSNIDMVGMGDGRRRGRGRARGRARGQEPAPEFHGASLS